MANYNYSFSGLKTAILYFLQKETKKDPNFIEKNINDLCASIQYTIVNILMQKLEKASLDLGIKQIAIAGGVSANSGIREAFLANEKTLGWKVFLPKFAYTTDNAAMIAMVGQLKYERQLFGNITDKSTAKYSIE